MKDYFKMGKLHETYSGGITFSHYNIDEKGLSIVINFCSNMPDYAMNNANLIGRQIEGHYTIDWNYLNEILSAYGIEVEHVYDKNFPGTCFVKELLEINLSREKILVNTLSKTRRD